MEVGFRSACPRVAWTVGRSAPPSTRCVAKLCRSRCGRTALVMPALCAASRQASHSTLGVIGLSAREPLTVPGNKIRLRLHPPPVLAQRLEQFWAQRHSPDPATLALADVDEHAIAVDIFDFEAGTSRLCAYRSSRPSSAWRDETDCWRSRSAESLLPASG